MRSLALFVLALLGVTTVGAAGVQVAVAANFAAPMAKIAEGFAAATGHTVKLSTGPTGKFFTQITHGAPFEVFLAADDERPARLVESGHAVRGTEFTYALGKLALWSAQAGLVDAQGDVLATGKFRHLAIANPKVAPYGVAAMEVIKARGLADTITPRLVTGESIAQAYQFVATGNAEIGFVSLSQVATPGKPAKGSSWVVPQALYGEIRQNAVLLTAGAGNPAARAFVDYLQSEPARQVIRDFGYGL